MEERHLDGYGFKNDERKSKRRSEETKRMTSKTPREYSRMLIKELFKHAQRDECYNCKQLLRAMGLNPENEVKESEKPLLEKLAELEHKQWAHWFSYQIDHATVDNLEKWGLQAETPYEFLSEEEKESDREWARIVLELLRKEGLIK